jgi:hypothetical protein
MTINCLARVGHAFGKGEVVSSILTGSTTRKTKASNEMGQTGYHAHSPVAPQCVLIRTEAGWPGSLNRFPVSLISAPLTFRMEISWSR